MALTQSASAEASYRRSWWSSPRKRMSKSNGVISSKFCNKMVPASPSSLPTAPRIASASLSVEAKETLRAIDEVVAKEAEKAPYTRWGFCAGYLERSRIRITKVTYTQKFTSCLVKSADQFGTYDRLELKTWHQGWVVLIGDAAHPTSPVRLL